LVVLAFENFITNAFLPIRTGRLVQIHTINKLMSYSISSFSYWNRPTWLKQRNNCQKSSLFSVAEIEAKMIREMTEEVLNSKRMKRWTWDVIRVKIFSHDKTILWDVKKQILRTNSCFHASASAHLNNYF
jgi:hypothetical protein